MDLVKTLVAAVVVTGMVIGSALLYIDHKIDEAADMFAAPIRSTSETVTDTIQDVEDSVTGAIESGERLVQASRESVTTTAKAITEVVEDAGRSVSSSVEDGITAATRYRDAVVESVGAAASMSEEATAETLEYARASLDQAEMWTTAQVEAASESAIEQWNIVMTAANDQLETGQETLTRMAEDTSEAVTDLLSRLSP